jgi:hypothetical protein
VNSWTSFWDSDEREKALLFWAERLRSSRTLVMSSSSDRASSGGTLAAGLRSFLSCWMIN